MGHHATYRKRGAGDSQINYRLPPPIPADWTPRTELNFLEAAMEVTPPSPATGLVCQARKGTDPWANDVYMPVTYRWYITIYQITHGDFDLRVRWASGTNGETVLSAWSSSKTIHYN